MRKLLMLALVCAANSDAAYAQELATRDPCAAATSRLFPLEYIRNADAAKLVAPFVPFLGNCGVFEAGEAVRGITVRAPRDVIDRVDSLLKANDKPPLTVVLRFQIIAALDSAGPADPAIQGDVTAALQELFRFRTYRLIAQGAVTVGTGFFEATMASADERYVVKGTITDIRGRRGGAAANMQAGVAMQVSLHSTIDIHNSMGGLAERRPEDLLSTGLTTPIGQTVVLGSAAAGNALRAIILTVRPDFPAERR